MTDEINRSPSDEAPSTRGADTRLVISLLWSDRRRIAWTTTAIAAASVIVSLLLPQSFRSTVTLLPEVSQDALGGASGLSGIAMLAGIGFGDVSSERLYPDILRSEVLLRDAIFTSYETAEYPQGITMEGYYDFSGDDSLRVYEKTLLKLRDDLEISVDRQTRVVTISILTRDPELSAAVVNRLAELLDVFLKTKRNTNASERRRWIERRLDEVAVDMRSAEDSLRDFREKNRRVDDSPQLLLEQSRLQRETIIQQTVYTELKTQLELVRIEEIKDIPVVNVLDHGRPATKKELPKRAYIVVFCTILGFLGICLFSLYAQYYRPIVFRFLAQYGIRQR